jgi:hypothetical protein
MANTFKFGNGEWAVGKETALAYNDENSNFKPLPFTFDRASTATVVNKDGLIETVGTDEPRIDFLNNTNGHLLLEPSRSNLNTKSEDIAGFSQFTNVTATNNQTTSPDGSLNASLVTADAVNNRHEFQNTNVSFTSGTFYTVSVFVKANGYDYFAIKFASTGGVFGDDYAWFNVSNGTIGTVDSDIDGTSIENYGSGWYKVTATQQANATASGKIFLAIGSADNTPTFLGDGSSGLYVWGYQIEAGSYATSYIPTSGSTATRSAETNEQTPPDGVIGQTEGTLFAQVGEFPKEHNGRIFAIGDGSADDYITIIKNGSNNNFAVYADAGGVGQVSYQGSGTLSNNSKIAVGYANNNYAIYVNGTQVHTNTNASVPSLVKIFMGSRENGSSTFILGGSITETKLYNTRLSNTELQALTS